MATLAIMNSGDSSQDELPKNLATREICVVDIDIREDIRFEGRHFGF
jgi:hypothetical protein